MKKRLFIFLVIMIASWIAIGIMVFCHFSALKTIRTQQQTPGIIELPEKQDASIDVLLAGEWEYYPGVHYVSDKISDTEISPSFITVPFNSVYSGPDKASQYEKNSYRLIIKNSQKFDNDGLILILPDLYTNFRVFFNGHERPFRLPSPYGYPVYNIIHTGTVEIVIETTGKGSSGLTAVPEITSISLAMLKSDTTKAAMGAFLAAYIVFIIVILLLTIVTKNIRTRNYILISLAYLISFISALLWGSGSMDLVMHICSLDLVSWIIFAATLCGIALIFRIHGKNYPERFTPSLCRMIYIILAAVFILWIIASILGIGGALSWIIIVSFLVCYISWAYRVLKMICSQSWDFYIMEIGVFTLFAASAANLINMYIVIPVLSSLVLPSCIVLYIAATLVMVLLYEKRITHDAQMVLSMEKDLMNVKTALFASRMNPHFVYNSLTTIQELCYTDPRKAAGLIVRFSKYLRTNLDFLDNTELVPFSTELDFINNYIYIQKERFSDSMEYIEDIRFSEFQLPPFSIQPLIENAINYGLRSNGNQGTVQFITDRDDKYIYIDVINDGPEFRESSLRENHSVSIIRKRLEDICRGTMDISYDSELHRSRVRITLPKEMGTE